MISAPDRRVKVVLICGPAKSGKTTAIGMICDLMRANPGNDGLEIVIPGDLNFELHKAEVNRVIIYEVEQPSHDLLRACRQAYAEVSSAILCLSTDIDPFGAAVAMPTIRVSGFNDQLSLDITQSILSKIF